MATDRRPAMFVVAALVAATVLWAGPTIAQAPLEAERILDFRAEIWIEPSGAMVVEETIRVVSAGRQIKRGIYRDIPTDYRDRAGRRFRVGFELLSVRRNDAAEPYRSERTSDGVRIYIGRSDVLIDAGEHKYTLCYRTDRQLGHFDGFDELYWNVTGNGWAFPIDQARARIHLPAGASVLQHAAYTGAAGDRGGDFTFIDQGTGAVWFETTRPLAKGEGLTVAVGWPQGFVARPDRAQRLQYFAGDHLAALSGAVGLALLLIYYLVVWWRSGRDPQGGPVVAQYTPPAGVSPAAARYLTRMGFDHKAFAAAIISMAVKGYLVIDEGRSGRYTLTRTGAAATLSPGEAAMAKVLFGSGRAEIRLTRSDRSVIVRALDRLSTTLRTEFEQAYFVTNRGFFWFGIVISALMVPVVALTARDPFTGGFLTLWLSFWSVGVYFLLRQAMRAWQAVRAGGGAAEVFGAAFTTLFAVPFVGAELTVLGVLATSTSIWAILTLVGILVTNLVFYHLLKAPTRLGRTALDRIAGFRTYLAVAERERMEFHNPPDETPELFERYLPYALALDVEHSWSQRFTARLAAAGRRAGDSGYRPGWYSGSGFGDGNLTDFGQSLASGLSNAVRSSSSSSSSGSSGGGSSGGGGGGGGGGGW